MHILTLCAAALAAVPTRHGAIAPTVQPGTAAPTFASSSTLGARVDLRRLRGKVVLLDFWMTT